LEKLADESVGLKRPPESMRILKLQPQRH